jgi:hypothetical protein
VRAGPTHNSKFYFPHYSKPSADRQCLIQKYSGKYRNRVHHADGKQMVYTEAVNMATSRQKTAVKPLVQRRECDLSPPIQSYLAAQGYTVRSEVNDCDITALDGENLIVIELKKSFSTDLLIQATDRQRIADTVYIALPVEGTHQRKDRYSKRWRGIEHLLKRLELGLILVHFPEDTDAPPVVEVVFHPVADPKPRRKTKRRQAVLREIAERSGDYNVGGTGGRAILTAYREQAIFIACCLDRHGPLSPSALRALGTSAKTQSILLRNVYGWYERLERGLYALRPAGREQIAQTYPGLAALYAAKVEEVLMPGGKPLAEVPGG